MPAGNSLALVVALLLCCLIVGALTYSQGVESERRHQSPHQHAKYAEADAQRACSGLEAGAMFDCVYKEVEASEETARTEQDLSAQQRAATSALVAAMVSALTLLVSGVGVWFVKRTLDATLEAVQDTSKATEAMEAQTKLMANAQRPWLDFDVELHELYYDTTATAFFKATVCGDSQFPAFNLRVFGSLRFGASRPYDESERTRRYIGEWFEDEKPHGPTIFPRATTLLEKEAMFENFETRHIGGPVMAVLTVALNYTFGHGSGTTFKDFYVFGVGPALADPSLNGSAASARTRATKLKFVPATSRIAAI